MHAWNDWSLIYRSVSFHFKGSIHLQVDRISFLFCFETDKIEIHRLQVVVLINHQILRKAPGRTFENSQGDFIFSTRHLRVNDGGCLLKCWYLCLARGDLVCSTIKLKFPLHNGTPFSERQFWEFVHTSRQCPLVDDFLCFQLLFAPLSIDIWRIKIMLVVFYPKTPRNER